MGDFFKVSFVKRDAKPSIIDVFAVRSDNGKKIRLGMVNSANRNACFSNDNENREIAYAGSLLEAFIVLKGAWNGK